MHLSVNGGDDDEIIRRALSPTNDDDGGAGGGGQQQQDDEPPIGADGKPDPWAAIRAQNEAISKLTGAVTQLVDRGNTPPRPPADEPPIRRADPPPSQSDQDAQRELAKKRLGDMLISDPGGFALELVQAARNIAIEESGRATAPLRQGGAMKALSDFRKDHITDPMFLAARDEFDTLVDNEIKLNSFQNLTHEQVEKGLDMLYQTAIGRKALKRAGGATAAERSSRSNAPPNYRMGSGGGSGTSRVRADELQPKDQIEVEIINSGREYGLTDQELKESLERYREEGA